MGERKTIDEVIKDNLRYFSPQEYPSYSEETLRFFKEVIKDYVEQEQKLAIEKALELASEEAEIKRVTAYSDFPKVDVKLFKTKTDSIAGVVETLSINKAGILSLKDRVIEELRK